MRRVVSLYLPTWPTDRLRRRLGVDAPLPDRPLIIVGRLNRRRVVVAADRAALGLRLYPGMAVSQAQALVSDLVVHDQDPVADAEALDQLAAWALKRYAPVVAVDARDGLILDVTGATHRYRGEQGLLDDLIEQTAAVGLTAQVAMSDTWGSAHALARYAGRSTLIVERGGPVMADLPTSALRIAPETVAALSKMGVDTIGEVEAKPRAALALRFGPDLTRRLDQAFGRSAEPIQPVEVPDLLCVRQVFAEPIGAPETLARYSLKLVEQLCADLEGRGEGALKLDLGFNRVDGRVEVIRVGTARPERDVRRLTRLLCDKIETVDPGLGVELMVLTAPVTQALDWRPVSSDLTVEAVPDVSDLIDVLANRFGMWRLYRLAPAQSDVPERCVSRRPPVELAEAETWPRRWPRPTRLLARPEPIATVALMPDQPPVSFTWRGIRRRVRRADGPERIFGEWWRRDGELDAVRDYFQIEDEAGERFWVFRRGDGERSITGDLSWYLHGLFG